MALVSSDVNPGDDIDASDHNDLIDDIEAHDHDGVDTSLLANVSVDTAQLANNAGTPSKLAYEGSDFNDISDVLHRKFKYTIGDVVLDNNAAEQTTQAIVWTKIKETKLQSGLPSGTTLRISFEAKGDQNNQSDARIYRNGVAVGISRDLVNAYAEYQEDIAGWGPEDLLQVYAINDFGVRTAFAKLLKVDGVMGPTGEDFTQQDP